MRIAHSATAGCCVGPRRISRGQVAVIALSLCLACAWDNSAQAQFNGSFSIDPVHLNRENWFDWRAYQPPVDWWLEAYRVPDAMQATVGSLSLVRFYQADDLRLEKDIGANATFLYSQSENSFFRSNPLYQEVEMRFGADRVYGSIIGFPYPDKSLANEGLALAWGKRTDSNTVRLSYLQEQAMFNEKTTSTSRYHIAPILNRLQARFTPRERLVVEVDYRDEPLAALDSPDLAERQTYRAQKLDARADWWVNEEWLVGAIVSDNTERRQTIPTPLGTASPTLDQALTWGWSELHAMKNLAGGDRLTLAVVDSRFENIIRSNDPNSAYRFRLRTTQVYGLWEWVRSPWLRWTVSLQVGELQLFNPAKADERNDTPTPREKLGLGAILAEARSYRFWFLSTWARDAISGQKWDGGNVQFQLFF